MTSLAIAFSESQTDHWRRDPSPYRDSGSKRLFIDFAQNQSTENPEDRREWLPENRARQILGQLRSCPVDNGTDAPAPSSLPDEIEAALATFAAGTEMARPERAVVVAAREISLAAVRYTRDPEITVDVDGELSFDLRLSNERLLLAELGINGRVHVGVHDENDRLEEHLTADYQLLLSMIKP